jgi:exodeoxyribonuclease VII small subunit
MEPMNPAQDGGPAGSGAAGLPGNEPGARSFEEEFAAAEHAVELLERGDLTLDDALRRYEEGLRALSNCYGLLERTRQRIEVLAGEVGCVEEGTRGPAWKPAAGFVPLREALETVVRAREAQVVLKSSSSASSAEGPS